MTKWILILSMALILLLISIATLVLGDTPWEIVWQGVSQRLWKGSTEWNPLLDERLPRLIVVLCSGASLAVSGVVMQSLFHNPLASPMSLGMTSGSSLAVVILFVLGWHLHYPVLIPIVAFMGSLLTLLAVYYTSKRRGHLQMTLLILTGIAFSTVLIAVQGAIIYALRDEWALVQTITEWEAGSTVDRTWHHAHLQVPLAVVGLMGCWLYRQEMNLLALGDDEALNLGVEVSRVRWRLFLCVSLLVGGAIAAVGIIAFFGLVLPHVLRKLIGADHRLLIPLSMAAGSVALGTLDLLLRGMKIHAFTIGSISAIIGGIFFLSLLFETRARETRLGF